ncbi:hypothetical protein PHPALM_27998 [Phytophthora palmivora]|uniref:M96 mating-specific protein family n=1 Tax=Phytophthora palmivora TaxID=4796 RepID=A0A2P4XB65_9STRA|nr:hypothetical protein PHPALM_27998 [Phytophthora palmivora]
MAQLSFEKDITEAEMDIADFQATSPFESNTTPHKRTVEMLPHVKRPNLSWKRRKEELHRLRAESQALETHVTFLKLRRTQMTLMNAGVGLSEEQKRWRDAAAREKQSCQTSRDENKLLNDKLESCIRTCNDLRTVLSVVDIKQQHLIVANAFAAKTLQTEKRLQLSSTALFSLENRINERHCELEYYFNHIQSTIPGRDVDQVTVHREGVEGTSATLEFKRKRLIPFNADITSREIWNTMHLGVFPADHSLQVSKCSDDTLASQGCETHPLECGGTVDLRVTCLMKRVVIPGGCVMLIESTTEWRARPVQAKAWSHVTTDSGWALVRPNGPRPDTCQLQFAIRLRTEDPNEQNAVTLLTPTVSDVVVPFFSDLLNTRQQLVENALSPEALVTCTSDITGIQPLSLSQPPLSDSDEVLREFLEEMTALDCQEVPKTPEPKATKRKAVETPRPDKKIKTNTGEPQTKTVTRWQRRKLEVQTLKEQADALSSYVEFLQTRRLPGQFNFGPELEQLLQLETGGWQAAAVREIRHYQASQLENRELKDKLQACVQVSGRLQTALRAANALRGEQLSSQSVASSALRVEMMMTQMYQDVDSTCIFDMLEANVNARVNEIQGIAGEITQPVRTANTEQVCICRKDEIHPAVEFKTVRVLPFEVDTVSNVCWRVAELGWKRDGARVVRRSTDVVSSDWCFPVQLKKGETVEIRVRSVAKRFRVQEGFVVLAESTTEWPAHLAASGAWSRVTRESGWGLVHSYPTNGNGLEARDSSLSPASVSRFVMYLTSEPSGLDSDTSRKLFGSPAVSDVVIPSFRKLIRNRQQCVDNRLMDAAFVTSSIAAI